MSMTLREFSYRHKSPKRNRAQNICEKYVRIFSENHN